MGDGGVILSVSFGAKSQLTCSTCFCRHRSHHIMKDVMTRPRSLQACKGIGKAMKPSIYLPLIVVAAAASQSASFVSYQSRIAPVRPIPLISDSRGAMVSDRHRHTITELNMVDTMEKKKEQSNNDSSENKLTKVLAEGGGTKKSRRTWVAITGVTALSAVCIAAKNGVLPGLPVGDGSFAPYTNGMIARDAGSALLALSLAFAFVKFITTLAFKGILDPKDSRKIIHTLTGPLFIATWPLFSAAWGARFFAALVGVVNSVRLILAASGDEGEGTIAV